MSTVTRESDRETAEYRGEALAVRGVIGGGLMGLANLVPGISGGTMLLAAGVYPQFIRAVAEATTLRPSRRAILLLGCIVGAALAAIAGFAGPVSALVVDHRWIMYSLFIGLTLGGVPILWTLLKPPDASVVVAALAGVGAMAAMTLVRPDPAAADATGGHASVLLFLAGAAAAAAMVLPGVSGGYLLLIMGQYVAILMAVDGFIDGASARDWGRVGTTLRTIVPVGLGVVAGVVGVSNLVKILLERCRRVTLGVLLGLLLGAVIGLWPFQEGVAPPAGTIFKGDTVVLTEDGLALAATGRPIDPEDYPTAFFAPSVLQVAGALALVVAGFAASTAISRLGGDAARA